MYYEYMNCVYNNYLECMTPGLSRFRSSVGVLL